MELSMCLLPLAFCIVPLIIGFQLLTRYADDVAMLAGVGLTFPAVFAFIARSFVK